jgi:hypothetical protein
MPTLSICRTDLGQVDFSLFMVILRGLANFSWPAMS